MIPDILYPPQQVQDYIAHKTGVLVGPYAVKAWIKKGLIKSFKIPSTRQRATTKRAVDNFIRRHSRGETVDIKGQRYKTLLDYYKKFKSHKKPKTNSLDK